VNRRLLVVSVALSLAPVAAILPARASEPPEAVAGGVLPTSPANRPNAEPGMAVDGAGAFYVSSLFIGQPPPPDNPTDTWLPGSGVWRSRDQGRTYQWLGDPLKPVQADPMLSFAGGDSDVAAAPEPNALGHYNVYAAALHISEIAVAVSPDGGDTWVQLPAVATPGLVDRPWVAAAGSCTFYLAYHALPAWVVERFDLCAPPGAWASVEPASKTAVPIVQPEAGSALAGKIVVDSAGRVYLPMETCRGEVDGLPEVEGDGAGCPTTPQIVVARSTDGGRTFTLSAVADVANGAMPIWAATLAAGGGDVLHAAWHDDHDAYLSTSADAGATWSAPVVLNPPGTTAVMPTVAAGPGRSARVAWYGADGSFDANAAPAGTPWRLWAASVEDGSTSAGPVTDVVHVGPVCTHGGACPSGTGVRNLYDDLGAATNAAGVTSVAYTTDQAGGVRTAFATLAFG
jgi:hypothetical protein